MILSPDEFSSLITSKKFKGLHNAFNVCFGLCATEQELDTLQAILGAYHRKIETELTLRSLVKDGTAGTDPIT